MELNEENMKFEKLTQKQADYVYGKLKLLEEYAADIEIKRESYTRLLLVNGFKEEEEFNEALLSHEKKNLSPVEEVSEGSDNEDTSRKIDRFTVDEVKVL